MDLWTNQEEQEQSLHGVAKSGHTATARSTRRLSDRAILALFRTWLLQEYAAPYCQSLGSMRIFRRCYWIDALGNLDIKKGTADNPSGLQSVTALAPLRSQSALPIAFHALLLTGRRTREQTTERKELIIPKESSILNTNWLESAATIRKEIEQSPAIFLLDPLSPVTYSYEDLVPLYQRTVPTEFCYLFAHKQIEQRLQAAAKVSAQAAALTALLRSDRWKALPKTGPKAITGFLTLFSASMSKHFQWSPQRIELPIQNGPASTIPAPYSLIYATRRQDSLLAMNNALCSYRRSVYQQSYRGVLGEEWFAVQEQKRFTAALLQLPRHIQQQGSIQRIRRWPDLRQHLILGDFGHFLQEEYDQSMQQLIAQQEVRCAWRQAPKAGEERIPANEDTLLWR